jgi:hypothetical protein
MFRGLGADFERTHFSHLGLLGDWLEKEKWIAQKIRASSATV